MHASNGSRPTRAKHRFEIVGDSENHDAFDGARGFFALRKIPRL